MIIKSKKRYKLQPKKSEDLTNKRFGKLTVTKRLLDTNKFSYKCDCGQTGILNADALKRRKSCGCRSSNKQKN